MAEARRGEELHLLALGDEVSGLRYQVPFLLCIKPRITITIDFSYRDNDTEQYIYEDTKGVLTRDARTKLAWLKEKHGIDVKLTR